MNRFLNQLKPHTPLVGVIVFFTLLRVIVAPSFGLGVDEAHYLLYARFIDLSYVDHPPLVGWIHFLCGNTQGYNEFFARVPAIALMGMTSYLSYDFLLRRGFCTLSSAWGVAALNASFIFGALGLMLLPENLLLIATFLVIRSVENLEKNPSWPNYLLLGLWLGVAGLSKYTAVLFVPSLFVYIAYKKRWDLVLTFKIAGTIGVGVVMILPVMVWNMTHEWISFSYQSEHVVGASTMALKPFIKSFSAQIGGYNPLLFIASVVGFVVAFRHKEKMALPLAIGGGVALFFVWTSFLKPVLPHWSAIFYLLFIPYGVAYMRTRFAKTINTIVMISLALSVVIHLELAAKVGTFGDYRSPFRDIVGYEGIVSKSYETLQKSPSSHKGIALLNWTYASRWMAYDTHKMKVYVLDEKNKQFALWNGTAQKGDDLLIVTSHFEKNPPLPQCVSFEEAGSYATLLEGEKVDTFRFVWCKGYKGEVR